MTAVAALAGAVLVSWGLRVVFITIVPAERLPAIARRALAHTGTVVMAALIASDLARDGGVAALVVPSSTLLALLTAGFVSWRTRNLGAAVVAALVTAWAAGLVG